MSIRKFQPLDVPAIIAVHQEAVIRINGKHYAPEQVAAWLGDDGDKETRWAASLSKNIAYVFEEQGSILGFGDLKPEGELRRLYVHPDHHGKGIGSTILQKLEAEAQALRLREIRLKSTIAARTFYERRGYENLGLTQHRFRNISIDIYNMRKSLP